MLSILFRKYPDKDWDYYYISDIVTMNYILKHPDKPWDWRCVSRNIKEYLVNN